MSVPRSISQPHKAPASKKVNRKLWGSAPARIAGGLPSFRATLVQPFLTLALSAALNGGIPVRLTGVRSSLS